MKNAFLSLRNALDYRLRQFFKWHLSVPRIKNEPKRNLYAHLRDSDRKQADAEAARLRADYHLDKFFGASKADHYRENLYYLAMIEKALSAAEITFPQEIKAADIGVSHWFYAQALHAALQWWRSPNGRTIHLWGYEIDAYRVYADFHARYDHALANIAGLEHTHYLPQAFEVQSQQFDLITLFFPFIFVKDHLEWGLPKSTFDPGSLLRDAWTSLNASGVLLIINQGQQEHQQQIELLEELEIPVRAAFEHQSLLYPYEHPRYVLVASR